MRSGVCALCVMRDLELRKDEALHPAAASEGQRDVKIYSSAKLEGVLMQTVGLVRYMLSLVAHVCGTNNVFRTNR